MLDLTFGEQVKIILSRRGMTIKELAEMIEARTGKKMSRQNLTQRLGRDNFQEQDMRMIAEILGCPFQLSILGESVSTEKSYNICDEIEEKEKNLEVEAEEKEPNLEEKETEKLEQAEDMTVEQEEAASVHEREITIGELVDMNEKLDSMIEEQKKAEPEKKPHGWMSYLMRRRKKAEETSDVLSQEAGTDGEAFDQNYTEQGHSGDRNAGESYIEKSYAENEYAQGYAEEGNIDSEHIENSYAEQDYARDKYTEQVHTGNEYLEEYLEYTEEEDLVNGDINPYTGREYQSNSVRMHPSRIGYVQVYDRSNHAWTDMTEWAFLGYQERKKMLLGKDYEPPIYLD